MEIAQHASQFYKKHYSPYQFILAIVNRAEFYIERLIADDEPASVLDDIKGTYIFAYEIFEEAFTPEARHYLEGEKSKYIQIQ